ncbi:MULTISPECIES: hypothetical protein [Sphingomonadaceae]|uniref:hypothetical protein n=1 Tax=Sphingomonadales TaxID=204457 RepID=UPI0007701DFB|nr:hypothetical protein [Sphingobium sp. TKS]AMK23252.1 hypothetical protein K426_11580 [Sphingobium sp. TKS]MCF8709072.1 hypothetical protein [Rhizorhapis sp. SPR117]
MGQTRTVTEKTLDEAELDFREAPGRDSAADLLTVATGYWNDAMIGDETYAGKVGLVRNWLAKAVVPVDPDSCGTDRRCRTPHRELYRWRRPYQRL